MGANSTAETLALLKAAQASPLADDIAKSFSQSNSATTGLTFYDLEAPAKTLYPVLTPLRNRIARIVGGRGIQANWKAITGINTSQMSAGVSEGRRSGAISHTTAEYMAAFRGVGLEDYVTFEADYAAQGFDDVKARSVEGLLRSTMIQEELLDLGGNTSVALGTTPTPSVTGSTTGGALVGTGGVSYNVFCVALTLAGYNQVAGLANGAVNDSVAIANATINATISRVSMDGAGTETIAGGVARKSVAAAATIASGTSGSIAASVAPVRGAVAYAWFWGTAGNEVLGAVTTINSILITDNAAGSQNISTLPAADNSTDALVYDGLLSQIMKSGSGAYFADLATGTAGTGTKLTSDGAGGITQIETALQSFWNNYRLSPDEIYVNSQQLLDMNTLIIKNGGAPLIRYNLDANGATMVAGTVIGQYLNKITGKLIKVSVHPNMPAGMIMFYSDGVPYSLSGVGNVVQKKLRRDYYQVEWPQRTRRYEYGVYFDGVLQNYFPPAFGVIRNIAAGV